MSHECTLHWSLSVCIGWSKVRDEVDTMGYGRVSAQYGMILSPGQSKHVNK